MKNGGEDGLRDSEEEFIHWEMSCDLNVEGRNYRQLSSDFLQSTAVVYIARALVIMNKD